MAHTPSRGSTLPVGSGAAAGAPRIPSQITFTARPSVKRLYFEAVLAAETALDYSDYLLCIERYANIITNTEWPTPHWLHYNLAMMYLLLLRTDDARHHLHRALEIDSHSSICWLMLGVLEAKSGRYDLAEIYLRWCGKRMRRRPRQDYEQLGVKYVVKRELVIWDRAMVRCWAGGVGRWHKADLYCVPAGTIWRMDGRLATGIANDRRAWGFREERRVVARDAGEVDEEAREERERERMEELGRRERERRDIEGGAGRGRVGWGAHPPTQRQRALTYPRPEERRPEHGPELTRSQTEVQDGGSDRRLQLWRSMSRSTTPKSPRSPKPPKSPTKLRKFLNPKNWLD